MEAVRPRHTTCSKPGGFASTGVCGLRPRARKYQGDVAAGTLRGHEGGCAPGVPPRLCGIVAIIGLRGWLRGRPHLALVLTGRLPWARVRVCPSVRFLQGQQSR